MNYLHQTFLLLLLGIGLHLTPLASKASHSNLDTLYISIPDLAGQIEDTITLNLRVRNFTEIVGVQFDFRFDTAAMSFVDLSLGDLEVIGYGSFGLGHIGEGSLRFSWADFTDRSHSMEDNTSLFALKMRVKQPLNSLQGKVSLSEEVISAEYISDGLEQGEVRLLIDELSGVDNLQMPISVLKVVPNPCRGRCIISFHLSAHSQVAIEVYNDLGQLISSQQLYLRSGEHQLPLQLPHAGRFWYRFQTPAGTQTQVVVVME